MVARMPPPRTRPAVSEVPRSMGLAAGTLAFALVGGVAVAAGVGVEVAALRAFVGAVVWGGLAAAGGYALTRSVPPPSQPSPRARGYVVDVTLPGEGDR